MHDVAAVDDQQTGGHGSVQELGQVVVLPVMGIARGQRPQVLAERPDASGAGDGAIGKHRIHAAEVLDPGVLIEQRGLRPRRAALQPRGSREREHAKPGQRPWADVEQTADSHIEPSFFTLCGHGRCGVLPKIIGRGQSPSAQTAQPVAAASSHDGAPLTCRTEHASCRSGPSPAVLGRRRFPTRAKCACRSRIASCQPMRPCAAPY